MGRLAEYIKTQGRSQAPEAEELDEILARCEWFTTARIVRQQITGRSEAAVAALAPWRALSPLARRSVDRTLLTERSAEEIIDRFLKVEELRIVAPEDGAAAADEQITTEAQIDGEDDVVSEELAEIYLAQGLREQAVAVYGKLSLLNPEKSVYFAELIDKIENN